MIKNIIYLLVYVLSFVHQFGWIAFHFCWQENRENYSLFSLGIRIHGSIITFCWNKKGKKKIIKVFPISSELSLIEHVLNIYSTLHTESISIHGILQARILEWVTISFSRGSSWPRDWTWVFCIGGKHFNLWATMEAPYNYTHNLNFDLCLLSCASQLYSVPWGRYTSNSWKQQFYTFTNNMIC